MPEHPPTLLRHGGATRLAHVVLALVVGVLIVGGLGVAERLPDELISLFGGHTRLATVHRNTGLAVGFALLVLALVAPGRLIGLLADVLQPHRGRVRWLCAFLRYSLHRRRSSPWHDGRFDPLQRLVFLVLGGSLLVLVVSGGVIYASPPQARLLLAWAIRLHGAAAVALIGAVCLHVFSGSGLLPSHRGVARAMLGDGRVSLVVARRLWPGWTRRATDRDRDE